MVSKILISLSVMLAVVAIVPAQQVGGPMAGAVGGWGPAAAGGWGPAAASNPWIPPWVASAPWFPKWAPCTTVGSTCVNCNTKQVCTKMGMGLERACTDPTLPYCNLGECSATPTAECAPVVAVPATAGAV